jgi:hypothetical protein
MVVALTKVKTQFLSGRFIVEGGVAKFQSVDGTKYNLGGGPGAASMKTLGNDDFHLGFTSGPAFFLNGDEVVLSGGLADEYIYYHVGNATYNQSAKLVVAAEVVGLTITNLHSVAIWDARDYSVPGTAVKTKGEHFLYAAGQISGTKFNGHNFPLDVNNEVDHNAYILKGVDSIDDLAADNVVYVYKNNDKTIRRIDVGTTTQAGTITNVNLTDFTRTIGGQTLVTAPYKGLGFGNDTLPDLTGVSRVGNEGTALLDIYYRIYDFKLGEASKGNFAVVAGIQTDTTWKNADGSAITTTNYKIVDKTGKEAVYELKSGSAARGDLIEYRISGGKIEVVKTGTPGIKGSVNDPRTLITIDGTNKVFDNGTLVFVDDGDFGYSLGSVKDLAKDLETFSYITGTDGLVKALTVLEEQAGAQKVFVLINSITKGWDGTEEVDVVSGINFATGEVKSWTYKGASLTVDDSNNNEDLVDLKKKYGTDGNYGGLYPTVVQFTVDENDVLKNAKVLAQTETTSDSPPVTLSIPNAQITSVGASTIEYTTESGITGTDAVKGAKKDTVAILDKAVLFKIDGSSWVSTSVRNYNFDLLTQAKVDDTAIGAGNVKYYTLLKSDPKGYGFDIIVEQNKRI